MRHQETYQAVVEAVTKGALTEPFSTADLRRACPGFGDGTYRAFLWKHSTQGKVDAPLERVAPGRFRLRRPFPVTR